MLDVTLLSMAILMAIHHVTAEDRGDSKVDACQSTAYGPASYVHVSESMQENVHEFYGGGKAETSSCRGSTRGF